MSILMCFDFLGIFISFLMIIFLLLGFSLPSGNISIILNIGIFVMVGYRLVITKKLRKGKNWFLDKSLKGIGPFWLKVVIGLVAVFGIVNCVISLSKMLPLLTPKMTSQDYVIASKNLFIGSFSLMMICFAIEFFLLYIYKILRELELQKLRSKDVLVQRFFNAKIGEMKTCFREINSVSIATAIPSITIIPLLTAKSRTLI